MFISKPNQDLNISACSAKWDLHNHIKKIAKGMDRFFITWKCKLLYTRPQALLCSRSTPLNLYWSFMHKEAIENTRIQLNFRNPLPWRCTWSARNLAQLYKVRDESCSQLHQDHEYAKRLKNYVKKIEFRRERKMEGNWDFEIWKFCPEQMRLGFGFYMVC